MGQQYHKGPQNVITVYTGDSGVTNSDGYPLYPLDEIELDVPDSVSVYAWLPSPSVGETSRVHILEVE